MERILEALIFILLVLVIAMVGMATLGLTIMALRYVW